VHAAQVFVQAAGAQLAFSSPRGSLAAMLAGVALGVAYHCNALGMRTWKVHSTPCIALLVLL
jgi:hypothetical protein